MWELIEVINQIDPIDTYRTFHSSTKGYFFSATPKLELTPNLSHRLHTQSKVSTDAGKLKLHAASCLTTMIKCQRKQQTVKKLGTKPLSPEQKMGQERRKKEIKDFLELNENEYTPYSNLWDTMEAVLRGKFIVLSAYIKKLERSYAINLTTNQETLGQKEEIRPKRSRLQKIIN